MRDVVDAPGQPLDASTRALMEPSFGNDFSRVRLHTDEAAAESARAINAKAYTVGSHVAFGAGQYQPGSQSGKRIMAHELTHVVQQASGPVVGTDIGEGVSVSCPNDHFERQANAVSEAFSRGSQPARTISASLSVPGDDRNSLHVQRFTDTSPDSPYQQRQTGAAEKSADYGEVSAIAGGVSAAAGVASAIIAGLAYGVSKDQLAEARKQNVIGQEALDTTEAQGTVVEGLNVTHASVPDFHDAKDSTKRKDDILIPILNIGVGADDFAQYQLRLQIDEKNQIRGGATEDADVQGYLGGFSGSNANITFSASKEPSSPDKVRIQFKGTNVAPKRKGAQRFRGEVSISAPKWERHDTPIKPHGGSDTKQAKGPWALIPPYTPPTPQAPVPTPKPPKKPAPSAPKKGGGEK